MKTKLWALASWSAFLVSAVGEWGFDFDLPLTPVLWLVIFAVCSVFAPGVNAALTTNVWSLTVSGKWEIGSNWTNGAPSVNNALDAITNGVTGGPPFFKIITIDGTTSLSNATMTVSNVLISSPSALVRNNLILSNVGPTPFTILNALSISNSCFVMVSNATMNVGQQVNDDGALEVFAGTLQTTNGDAHVGNFRTGEVTVDGGTWLSSFIFLGFNVGTTGNLWVTDGKLISTNDTVIGFHGAGSATISNGTWRGNYFEVGDLSGANGTLTWAGGTNTVDAGVFNVGADTGSTGTVWLTGGSTTMSNSFVYIGTVGAGQMTVSNGTLQMVRTPMTIGDFPGAKGTLTIAGGTSMMTTSMLLGSFANATGTVWLTGGQLVVTNDSTIIGGSGVGQMTVSNGLWLGRSLNIGTTPGSVGSVSLVGGTNVCTGPLLIGGGTGTLTLENLGLTVTNNPVAVVPFFNYLNLDGTLVLTNGGTIIISNNLSFVNIGSFGSGTLTNLGGSLMAYGITVGTFGGSQGTLTMSAGTITTSFSAGVTLGNIVNTTGTVWMIGGLINSSLFVGSQGVGRMTVSNGTTQVGELTVGLQNVGTFTCAGGTNNVFDMEDGWLVGGTGQVWVTGGQFGESDAFFALGIDTVGRMAVSNGVVQAKVTTLGSFTNGLGILTMAGGTYAVYSNMTLGNCLLPSTGIVTVAGGTLTVTNTSATAVLDVRGGTLTVSGGTLWVDTLVMTNACGRFARTGGILVMNNLPVLGPDLDADGDGLPNQWEQVHGLNALSASGNDGADGDPDHDGFTNIEEYEGGTDPQDPNSIPFRITSVMATGNDVRVTWLTAGGKTNQVQATNGSSGNYATNGFANVGSQIIVSGSSLTTTNYLDVGGATNTPSRFYRVRLVP